MRYLLFSGDDYYPAGGWWDFDGAFETLQEAKDKLAELKPGWSQIVDLTTMEDVT